MELFKKFEYICGHETHRYPAAVGEKTFTGHPADKTRQVAVCGCPPVRSFQEFCFSLVRVIQEERQARINSPTDTGTPSRIILPEEKETVGTSSEGSPVRGLFHRFVDTGSYCQSDKESDRHSISSGTCLEDTERHGLELSKAGATSFATKGKGYRTLEAVQVAAYKKTLKNLVPTWCSWMRVALCLSPMLSGLGLPVAKRRLSATGSNKTKYLPSVLFPFLLNEGISRPTSASEKGISSAGMLSNSSAIWASTCKDISSLYGTVVRYIKARRLFDSFRNSIGFMWNGFLHMLRSLIRWNISGAKRILHYPMEALIILPGFQSCYAKKLQGYVLRRAYYGVAFAVPSYPYLNYD